MTESLKPEWRVLLADDGSIVYHNDKTGEETKESPYLSILNKYKDCDVSIWQSRRNECVDFAQVHPRPRLNLDLNYGDRIGGRITVELFADIAPLACYNFYCLCTGELPDLGSQPLKLKGSLFCKCIPGQGMLGGDITNGDGTGGMSIYGAPFEDENTNKPLDRAGLLLSLSDGLNLFALQLLLTPSNLSRFLITSAPTPQLFGSASLFGRVVRGLAVIRTAMTLATDAEGHTSEPIVIANTSVAPDGPIPHDFTFPVKPSLRPNPTVPAACDALSYTKTVAGLAHEYTKRAKATAGETTVGETTVGETTVGETPSNETPATETPTTEMAGMTNMDETAPGVEPAPPGAPAEEPVNTSLPYYMYGAFENGGYYQPPAEEEETAPGEEKKEKKPRKEPEWETATGIISAGMDDYRRGNMPKDNDGRALAHYLDLSTLDTHTAKKKNNKIPKGFKTWKEYGEFKKKEKRARQVHDILEDKYPVEYLEKRRHH
ncbi:hypothetical protein BLSTO_04232 [Blastocystis sp. subtype 1]